VRIRGASLTSGPVTGYEEKSYRYHRDPDWTPGDPRYRDDPPAGTAGDGTALTNSTARMHERLRVFCQHRDAGLSIAMAGRATGVASETSYKYERARRAGLVPPDPAAGGSPAPPGCGARQASPQVPPNAATPPPGPVRGPGPAAGSPNPAGVAAAADSTTPAGPADALVRAAQRDQWRRAQSARNAGLRRGRTRRAPKQTGPGMIRRTPPGDDAA
jgi:hypothetical protein